MHTAFINRRWEELTMIKEKDLREMRPQVRFAQGQNIDLSVVQSALQQNADENGIPVAFSRDQVKYGGLIGGAALKVSDFKGIIDAFNA